MSIKHTLNYWMSKDSAPFGGEFLGFASIAEEAAIGLAVGEEVVAPMFLFQNSTGWGDGVPTSPKFSWVVYVNGTDDHSLYMLFGARDDAVKYAQECILEDTPIDPWKDTYKDRKWCWQN